MLYTVPKPVPPADDTKILGAPWMSYNIEDIKIFQQAVKDFLALIRKCNPKAYIIWCYGMIGIPFQLYLCEAVSFYAHETNDRFISYLQLPDMTRENVGSREHPGFLCHQQAAQVLAQYIISKLCSCVNTAIINRLPITVTQIHSNQIDCVFLLCIFFSALVTCVLSAILLSVVTFCSVSTEDTIG